MSKRSTLTVILHADVVGSTSLVQRDEGLAHERIQNAFDEAGASVSAHGGDVREIRGDAMVAIFDRPSDAVTAALRLQQSNERLNERYGDDLLPKLRIGIALGEVIVAPNTVTGEGVVLAQRLEQEAATGGVVVQGAVHDALPGRLPFTYEDLGALDLKGFELPVRGFRVALAPGSVLPEPEIAESRVPDAPNSDPSFNPKLVAGIAALLIVAPLVVWLLKDRLSIGEEAAMAENSVAPLASTSEKTSQVTDTTGPSIAVLPFDNMSDDPNQDYFGNGLAEDLITDLSKIDNLRVIARNSSFSFRDKGMTINQIGNALGVKYVLEGSVRKAGGTVRINAQLINVADEGHLWAERYDGSLDDVFGLQDQVATKVLDALKNSFDISTSLPQLARGTNNAKAYDAYLKAMSLLAKTRQLDGFSFNPPAREAFERAIALDESYAEAYAGLGWTYWAEAAYAYQSDSLQMAPVAWEYGEKSIQIRDNALGRRLLAKRFFDREAREFGRAMVPTPDHDAAIGQLRQALALEPKNPDVLMELAQVLLYAGNVEEAGSHIQKAVALEPRMPRWYHRVIGIEAFLKEEFDRAVDEFFEVVADEGAKDLNDAAKWMKEDNISVWIASALGHLGKTDAANDVLFKDYNGAIMTTGMAVNLFAVRRVTPLKQIEDMDVFLAGLELAGVPELPEPAN